VTRNPATNGPDDLSDGLVSAERQAQVTLVLLDRVRGGDTDAVNRLLERHRTAIRRMIDHRMDRVIERRVDASDIVQDVMIEANRRLGDYLANPTMPFRLWLRHMARDRLIDAHRRHRVAATRSLDREVPLVTHDAESSADDGFAAVADRDLTPAAAATWHELERRFAAAVERLDDDDRRIVLLRHFEHLSTAEAAEVLGLTKPAAGMRYLRAMRRLRGLLDGGAAEA
jgi:RNA polymerase sigma-70 factor (ECF subfamily)